MRFIPYGNQCIDDNDIEAVTRVLRSDYLTTGPQINNFEEAITDYVGSKYAVAIANGTAALHAACYAAGIEEGDEVITTPMTFAATANAVLYCKGKPVFADIDPITYNIDPKDIERKITKNTKAIIPVHYTGQPCDMDSILEIARRYNLTVIEDGAHALGAKYKKRNIGTIGDMTTFSFHPVKPITTGEGGCITTDDEELYERLKLFRTHGITKDFSFEQGDNLGSWYYEQTGLGFNYRMTDIQAALGANQLTKIDSFINRRREIASIYSNELKDLEGISIPKQLDNTSSGWHIYVLKLDPNKLNRTRVFNQLKEKGLGVNVHYIPVYYHPYYQELGYKTGICKNAEELYDGLITIPLYPKMTDDDVWYVIDTIKQVINYNLN